MTTILSPFRIRHSTQISSMHEMGHQLLVMGSSLQIEHIHTARSSRDCCQRQAQMMCTIRPDLLPSWLPVRPELQVGDEPTLSTCQKRRGRIRIVERSGRWVLVQLHCVEWSNKEHHGWICSKPLYANRRGYYFFSLSCISMCNIFRWACGSKVARLGE